MDAILRLRALVESNAEQGRVTLAVSLDIVNAFNFLPYEYIA